MYTFFFRILFFLLVPSIGFTQINVKIGYNGEFYSNKELNNLVDKFNEQNTNIENNTLSPINWTNGLLIGMLYRNGISSVGLSFSNNVTRDEIYLLNESSDKLELQDLRFSNRRLSLEYRLEISRIIVNLNYAKNFTRFKSYNSKITFSKENHTQLGFALEYSLYKSENISVNIGPYFRFSLSPLNLEPTATYFQLDNYQEELKSFPNSFGISFILINGQQLFD